jgi:hypothetical protein
MRSGSGLVVAGGGMRLGQQLRELGGDDGGRHERGHDRERGNDCRCHDDRGDRHDGDLSELGGRHDNGQAGDRRAPQGDGARAAAGCRLRLS